MEESRLIQRAGEGDASAFNTLMEMHERRMYAVALRMCGNPEDAQDCLQEAMLRIYRAINSFKAQSSFSTGSNAGKVRLDHRHASPATGLYP